MSKSGGGGFGYVLVIVVLVILLMLSVKAWKNAAPAAVQALKPGAPATLPDHGQTDAAKAIRSGNLPDMKKMGRNTDDHIQEINQVTKGQD
jgi:hypothetical protein